MEYYFDHEWSEERERLRELERFCDPITQGHCERVGISPGWRCLEFGGGGGSVAEWLAWRVGPTGHVLATDLETRFLEPLAGPNLEVKAHRMGTDPLPQNRFDLVHSRAVLEHQPDRMPVLRQVLDILRPGGWAVLESSDFSSMVAARPEHEALFDKGWGALDELLAAGGFRSDCGRHLSCEMEDAGFQNVSYSGLVYEWGGSLPLTKFYVQTFERIGQALPHVEGIDITDEEFRAFIEMCKLPNFRATSNVIVSLTGQKRRD